MGDAFTDWVEGKAGWEWLDPYPTSLFFDPYAAARAFYPPWVFDRLVQQQRYEASRRHAVAGMQFIDDVAAQLR